MRHGRMLQTKKEIYREFHCQLMTTLLNENEGQSTQSDAFFKPLFFHINEETSKPLCQ